MKEAQKKNAARPKRINAEIKRLRKDNPKLSYREAQKKAGKTTTN